MATTLNDFTMLQKLEVEEKLTEKSISYHRPCKLKYFNKHKNEIDANNVSEDWKRIRDFNKIALDKL